MQPPYTKAAFDLCGSNLVGLLVEVGPVHLVLPLYLRLPHPNAPQKKCRVDISVFKLASLVNLGKLNFYHHLY